MATCGRVLVTGATGLLGSHVVEQVLAAGGEVVALVREASPTRAWIEATPGVEVVWGELLQPASYRHVLSRCDAVAHCAGYVGDGGPDEPYLRGNVEATKQLLELLLELPSPPRLVVASTLGVYPLTDHYGTDEEAETAEHGCDPYISSKIIAERLVRSHVDKLPIVILRPGFMYGERDRVVVPRIMEFLRRGVFVYIGSRTKLLDNTYAGNAAYAFVLAMTVERAVGQIYNVTDDPLVTKKEFVTAVAKRIGHIPPLVTLPDWYARWIVQYLPWLPLTWGRYKFLGKNLEYSIDRIVNELGYTPPTKFEQGIERSLDWLTGEGMM